MSVELSDVPVRSLVPGPLQSVATADEYMARLPEFDGEMAALLAEAEAAGECLRYVGVVDVKGGAGSVELRRYPKVGRAGCRGAGAGGGEWCYLRTRLPTACSLPAPPSRPASPRLASQDHPFAQLVGSDNIIAFTTQRYAKQPLIVRGPGAGAEVTAGGVFSDLLRLAAYLGAPS